MTKLRKGFSLIEVVVATALLAFFLGSVIAAMIADAHNGPIKQRGLQAANLAREGIQLVSQVRDTAWLHGATWATMSQNDDCYGLAFGDRQLVNNTPSTNSCNFPHWHLVSGDQLPIPLNGINYTRKITITDQIFFASPIITTNNAKVITVTVSWMEGGQPQSVILKRLITNWKDI